MKAKRSKNKNQSLIPGMHPKSDSKLSDVLGRVFQMPINVMIILRILIIEVILENSKPASKVISGWSPNA